MSAIDSLVWFIYIACISYLLVYLCLQMFNASTELENAETYPRIRLFTVSDTSADEPQFELMEDSDVWTLPNKGV